MGWPVTIGAHAARVVVEVEDVVVVVGG